MKQLFILVLVLASISSFAGEFAGKYNCLGRFPEDNRLLEIIKGGLAGRYQFITEVPSSNHPTTEIFSLSSVWTAMGVDFDNDFTRDIETRTIQSADSLLLQTKGKWISSGILDYSSYKLMLKDGVLLVGVDYSNVEISDFNITDAITQLS